ncbi:MAG: formyltetrahydrofolate deformylase [Microbacteriaceae bacterium]|jgi:formyltetrahydrofolate deformylase|nr:formyltetrahydrofolate deformylase [Microbacteriaceae bacterium]MCI1207552.1 formyltetrahydrofolate deformylase [Microbacteriaceae bacterium]
MPADVRHPLSHASASDPEAPAQWILTLTCQDHPGIVHDMTGAIVALGGNIETSQQFHSPDSGRFFMRLRISSSRSHAAVTAAFAPLISRHRLSFTIDRADRPARTLILVSRAAHCLQDLLFRQSTGQIPIDVVQVLGNHPDLRELSAFYSVPFDWTPVSGPEQKAAFEERLLQVIEQQHIELVVLARYMQVLSPEFCDRLSGHLINIHHSFLPGFKGANPYLQAHRRGVKLIGATAHFVTPDLDEGPIIEQNVVRVDHSKTPDQLRSIGQDVEARTLRQAVTWFAEHRILQDQGRTIIFQ